MSTDNHDQPAAPQGSAGPQGQAAREPDGSTEQPRTGYEAGHEGTRAATAAQQPVQQVSAPASHPQDQPTQELHPQEQQTTPYPTSYGAPHRPQPQYGQYAQGQYPQGQYPQNPYGRGPYPGYSQYGQHPQGPREQTRSPYPQQFPAQHPGQPAGAAFGHPAAAPSSGGGNGDGSHAGTTGQPQPGKARGWAPLVAVAAITAVLASGGTVALVNAFDDGTAPTSISDLGSPGRVDTAPVQESTNTNPDWNTVTTAVSQSVVAIQMSSSNGSGLGSGFIYDTEGHVVTNNHVVSGATDDTVQVTLSDGRVFQATIVGTDATTDLAVVQIQDAPDDLTPVSLGDSEGLDVGNPVLAVGNPLGLANTATTGIISALDRPVTASGENSQEQVVTNAIQIDAAINPGNSGGPLFNAQGQVIGVTSSIATLSGSLGGQSGSIGLGFAIPVNLTKNIADQLIENGSAQHAFLGVSMVDGIATADGVTRRGAEVRDVTAGSPADTAGIRSGDVIVAIGDDPVGGAESLTGFVREREAGEQATLTIVRDGRALEVTATFTVREESATQQQPQEEQQQPQVPGRGSDQGSQEGSSGDDLWGRLFGN